MSTPAETLTKEEQAELVEQERIVQQNLSGFERAANALAVIKRKKLFRQSFPTWQNYCQTRWNMTGRWANDLIEDSGILAELRQVAAKVEEIIPLPEHQSQVHALRDVPPEKRLDVLKESAASNRGFLPPAKDIQKVADKYKASETKIASKGLKRMNQQKLLDSITDAICKYEEAFPAADSYDLIIADLHSHIERMTELREQLLKSQTPAAA